MKRRKVFINYPLVFTVIFVGQCVFVLTQASASGDEYELYFKQKEKECVDEYLKEGRAFDWKDSCYAHKLRKTASPLELEEISKGIIDFDRSYRVQKWLEYKKKMKHEKESSKKPIQKPVKKAIQKPIKKPIEKPIEKNKGQVKQNFANRQKASKPEAKPEEINRQYKQKEKIQKLENPKTSLEARSIVKKKTTDRQTGRMSKADGIKNLSPVLTQEKSSGVDSDKKLKAQQEKPREKSQLKKLAAVAALPTGLGQAAARGLLAGHNERGVQLLQIRNVGNSLTFKTEYEKEKKKYQDSAMTRRSRIEFKETLEMNYKGSIYHPKLFDFDLNLGISPDQLRQANDLIPEDKHKFRKSLLTDVYFNGQLLKEKPVYGSVFINKQQQEDNKDFFERQKNDVFAWGQQVGYKNGFAPMDLSFNHSENDITRTFRNNLSLTEDILEYQIKPKVPVLEEVQLEYNNDQFNRKEDNLPTQKGKIHNASASNTKKFGEQQQHDLSSYIRYYDLSGYSSSKDFSDSEALLLRHNDWLSTVSQYHFSDRQSNGFKSQNHDLSTGVRHELFESLSSSFDIKGGWSKQSSYDEKKAGFLWSEDYKKKIGVSTLLLGYHLDYEQHHFDSSSDTFRVINESHQLKDSSIVYLNSVNVDASSIRVKSPDEKTTYTQDSDYSIILHEEGRVEIKRIALPDGQEVLVDYVVLSNPALKYDQQQRTYRWGLNFFQDKLRFYQNFKQNVYSHIKGKGTTILEEFDDTTIGSTIDYGWTNFNVEHEEYSSDLMPFKALRLNQNFQFKPTNLTELLLSARYDKIDFREDTRNLYDLRNTFVFHLGPSASYRLEAGQLWQKGNGIDERRRSIRNAFQRQINKLLVELGYEFEMERFLHEDRTNNYVYARLKRDF